MIGRIIVTMLAGGLLGAVVGLNLGGRAAPTRESEAARIRDMVQRDPAAALNQAINESQANEAAKTFEEAATECRKHGAFVGAPIGLVLGLVTGLAKGKPHGVVSRGNSQG